MLNLVKKLVTTTLKHFDFNRKFFKIIVIKSFLRMKFLYKKIFLDIFLMENEVKISAKKFEGKKW